MYLVVGNLNFHEGFPIGYAKTIKDAEIALRKAGYHKCNKYPNKGLWLNSNSDLGHWASINAIDNILDAHIPTLTE